MCVVCRQMVAKNDCIRVVKTPQGEFLPDTTGKLNGRGAYVCKNNECIEKCIKTHAFNRSFKSNVNNSVYDKIGEQCDE